MEPEAFVVLKGEARDAKPEEQEYQMGTTVPACLIVAWVAEEGDHTSVERWLAVQHGGRTAVVD